MKRTASHTLFLATALGGLALASGSGRADDLTTPGPKAISPEQARCQAMGEGFFAVKGSTNCVRISGYVSAGVGFATPVVRPVNSPFAAHAGVVNEQQAGVAVEQTFNSELGPGRIYVQVGGQNWGR